MPSTHAVSDYRADVDGLRAIAVGAVLIFHAFPAALPGGFAGVDLFFVISGYLISRIILGDLKRGTFTFADFYSRRIRRIFPALTLVLVVTLLIGWWGLLPADFRQLGSHVVAGAAFLSNILLWNEAGYFDTAAEIKPLLHLWSLGVEEQYYLVWPVMLIVFRRHLHRIFWLILLVALGSFAVNIVATIRYPDAAFYLPIPRFWELMIGSVIAYAQVFRPATFAAAPPGTPAVAAQKVRSQLLSTAGVLLLVGAFALLSEKSAFPGWWALLPTGGAALLICAGPTGWFNRYVLSSRIAVFIGLISYPLYLWHWPLLTYARIFNAGERPAPSVRVAALIASFVLAWLTYEFLEKKIRHARKATWSHRVVPALATSMVALAIYGVLAYARVSEARSASIPNLAAVSEAFDDWHYNGDGIIAGDTERAVIFIGDSHMQQYLPRIEKVMKEHRAPVRTVIFRTLHGCSPVPGIERPGRGCDKFVANALKTAHEKNIETVVIGASWMGLISRADYYKAGEEYQGGPPIRFLTPESQWVLDDFEAQLKGLVDAGKRVVLVLSSPRGNVFDPRRMVRKDGFDFEVTISPPVPRDVVARGNSAMDQRLREMAARVGATIVTPLDALCSVTECPAADPQGAPLYKDESHVRTSVVVDRFDLLDPFVYLDGATTAGAAE